MVLLKENHIRAAGGVGKAVCAAEASREKAGRTVRIEVEVEDLDQLEAALAARPDVILLDNMGLPEMREAVSRNRKLPGRRPELEASGGITLENVREVAETGVDLISIGELTHSVKALDVSLLFRTS